MTTRPRRLLLLALVLAASGVAGWVYWSRAKTSELLRRGEEALAARDYTRAREHLERYLSDRPDDPRARLLAARAARCARDYDHAREHLRALRERGGELEPIVVEEALIQVQRGDEQPVAFLRQQAKRDDDLALVILEVLIQHDLDTYQLHGALDGLTRYLERRPTDVRALVSRAHVWERFHSFADALTDYRRAVAADPDNPRTRLKLAETALLASTPQEAREHFLWLAERDSKSVPVRLGLARCARRLGDPDEARKRLDAILDEAPDHGETLWERGELEMERDNPAAAESYLRRATANMPHDRRPHYALHQCLLRLDKKGEAEAVDARVKELDADVVRLRQVIEGVMKNPNDAALRHEGGLLFLRNGEREQGIRWLRIALLIDPDHEPARKALAEATRQPEAKAKG
jgi:tetratricopeptide (TPR) repeat protein